MLKWFICSLIGHDRVYWEKEKVDAEKVMGGVFTPYSCKRCGFESTPVPYPQLTTPRQPVEELSEHG